VLLVSHDRALLDAVPDRIVAFEGLKLRSYDGGWADVERERAEPPTDRTPEPSAAKPRKPKATRPPAKVGSSELDLLEGRIAETETRIADLERRLAESWQDMDLLTAHRAARDELAELLSRWEVLFEDARAT
jgi:ATP-binding cassette subfamily F protein 3